MHPIQMDAFIVRSWTIRFVRNEKKEITAFVLNPKRVRNLRFDKLGLYYIALILKLDILENLVEN